MIINAKVWLFIRGSDGEAIMERVYRLPFVPSVGTTIVLFDGDDWPGHEVARVIQHPLSDPFGTGFGDDVIHAEIELCEESVPEYRLIEIIESWMDGDFSVVKNSITPLRLREEILKTKIDTE